MNPGKERPDWFEVAEVSELPSPCLLVYRQGVEENISRMLRIAGGPARLRPHIKTHKIRELITLQLKQGITKFKCATIAEAEMAAEAGVSDLLIAYQPVGPATRRIAELVRSYPSTKFSIVCDDGSVIRDLSQALKALGPKGRSGARTDPVTEVLVDLDVGQHRTGIAPGPAAAELYQLINSLPCLKPGGFHAYDGHIVEPDPAQRAAACEAAFAPVAALRDQLEAAGLPVPRVVAGGTPTFPFHARRSNVECSPGTCVFWDAGYSNKFRDLDFMPAALVLTRVISKPGPRKLCLDLGHKAIASEMPPPRVQFLNLQDATPLAHSEEHLLIQSDHSGEVNLGQCFYGMPWHICPTVALYSEAMVVEAGKIVGSWKVVARERRLRV